MPVPPIQFCSTPTGSIAYQVVGEGPDLTFISNTAWNLDILWEHPVPDRFLRRLASFARLILVCPRGYTQSDPVASAAATSVDEWQSDFAWVMEAVGSEQAHHLTSGQAGPFTMQFAAAHPDLVASLTVVDSFPSLIRRDGYPIGMPAETYERFADVLEQAWGTGAFVSVFAPELADDPAFAAWYSRLERNTASPAMQSVLRRLIKEIDIRHLLGDITAPTLVVSHADNDYIRPAHSRYLAEHIPNAHLIERPGKMMVPWLQDADWLASEVEAVVTGTRGSPVLEDRILATVMFSDIVDSTVRASRLGDQRWRDLLDAYEGLVRRYVERSRGRVVKFTGDGVLATFDGPARAIRCALALRDEVARLGLASRTGLHTGEIEMRGDDVGGIAVHLASRVMAAAGAQQVLVSSAVPPLVAGSELRFEDLGPHALKGVPGEWHLLAVTTS